MSEPAKLTVDNTVPYFGASMVVKVFKDGECQLHGEEEVIGVSIKDLKRILLLALEETKCQI